MVQPYSGLRRQIRSFYTGFTGGYSYSNPLGLVFSVNLVPVFSQLGINVC